MSHFTTTKAALAGAAMVMALGATAPAHAGSITFEFDYTAKAQSGIQGALKSLVTGSEDLNPKDQKSGYTAYLMTSIVGTRTVTNLETGVITNSFAVDTLASGPLTTDAVSLGYTEYFDGVFHFDNIIYVNTTTGLASLDTLGLAYFGVSPKATNEFDVCFEDGKGSCLGYETGIADYREVIDTGNETQESLKIRQVPAPTALALLGASFVGMGLVRRRRKV